MANFLNLFIIFIALNYDNFLQNIKATNNSIDKKEIKDVFTLEKIQKEKYEINGKIRYSSLNSPLQVKHVKITEIEYDGIEIKFVDKDRLPINIKEPEFYKIIGGDFKSNDRDYYFEIISIVFKVTAFIEKQCFHTTLWYVCLSNPIKISTSFYDQLTESFNIRGLNVIYKGITLILPLNYFDNNTYSNSERSENQNTYHVDNLKAGQKPYVLNNFTINNGSKTHNINYFISSLIYSELYTKIYCKTIDHGIIERYIGKNINQCNINEKVLFFCTKIHKPQDENNNKKIQNKNNLKNQNVSENTSTIPQISYNTQTDEIENLSLDLMDKCRIVKRTSKAENTSKARHSEYK